MLINNIEWSEDDITLVEKFESIRQKGFYCSGKDVVNLYNKLLGKRQPITNCGACLRGYIDQMYSALNHAREKAAEVLKKQEPINAPKEENKPETKVTKKKK